MPALHGASASNVETLSAATPERRSSRTRTLPIAGGQLVLLPEGAAFEPVNNVLLVADVHLGKAQSFRRLGVPVPHRPDAVSMARLSRLIEHWRPSSLVFQGDLIHDRLPAGHPLFADIARWRHSHGNLNFTLVTGNHDHKAGGLPAQCGIEQTNPGTRLGPLQLLHDPAGHRQDHGHGVAGHIHPVVRLNGRADSVRVRCFWARPSLTVLPAFGEFTGGYRIAPQAPDTVYLLDGRSVLELPVC